MAPTRVLALDPGSKRIGIALSDELGWTAQPLETYERRTLEADVAHIRDLVSRHEVCEVVLGWPLRTTGQAGPEAQEVERFHQTLLDHLPVPVVLMDERLTSQAAERVLLAANVSRKKRKGAVDRVAAALLLESYLATRASNPDRRGACGTDEGTGADGREEEWSEHG